MGQMKVLENDFENVAVSNLPFDQYRNGTFLITGATGLIGSLLIKNLLYINEKYQLNIRVLGMVRNPAKADCIFSEYKNRKELQFLVQDMNQPFHNIEGQIDYIIHTAAITASKEMITYPVETIQTALTGTTSILELAREKRVKATVYVSSMEVYGNVGDRGHKITENELGYIDISSVRSGYPEGKRLCECLCNAYAKQYGMKVMSARLAQTFGAGILPGENRVFAQFARSAVNGTDIVLHTKGLSEGNYVYTSDAVKALLLLLTEGQSGEAYNISNEESHTTIAGMAEMVAEKIGKNAIRVIYDIPENANSMGYAPDVKLHLSSEKLRRLGWEPEVGLLEAYEKMIAYMKEDGI